MVYKENLLCLESVKAFEKNMRFYFLPSYLPKSSVRRADDVRMFWEKLRRENQIYCGSSFLVLDKAALHTRMGMWVTDSLLGLNTGWFVVSNGASWALCLGPLVSSLWEPLSQRPAHVIHTDAFVQNQSQDHQLAEPHGVTWPLNARGPTYHSQHALHDKIQLICQTLLRKTSRVTASAHIITCDCLTHPPPSSRALDEITWGFGPQPAMPCVRKTACEGVTMNMNIQWFTPERHRCDCETGTTECEETNITGVFIVCILFTTQYNPNIHSEGQRHITEHRNTPFWNRSCSTVETNNRCYF